MQQIEPADKEIYGSISEKPLSSRLRGAKEVHLAGLSVGDRVVVVGEGKKRGMDSNQGKSVHEKVKGLTGYSWKREGGSGVFWVMGKMGKARNLEVKLEVLRSV